MINVYAPDYKTCTCGSGSIFSDPNLGKKQFWYDKETGNVERIMLTKVCFQKLCDIQCRHTSKELDRRGGTREIKK